MEKPRPTRLTHKPAPLPPPAPIVLPPDATGMDALLLQKLTQVEAAMHQHLGEAQQTLRGMVQLLEAIIAHLETAAVKPEVPMATYEAMYEAEHPIIPGPPEGELVADVLPQVSERPVGWWGRLFTTRETP